MPWFKVDDSFYDHPKVFDAPDCALALWVRAGTWSARNLKDGFVPAKLPARLCDDPDTAVRELVDRGLWRRTKGGYQFHDWTVYQPTREEVERDRKSAAERQRRRRNRIREEVNAETVTPLSRRDSRVSHTGSPPVSSRPPSRPDPSRRDGEVHVGDHPPRRNAPAREEDDDQDPLIQTIIGVLHTETGRTVTPDWADRVRAHILAGRAPRDPTAYVAACIRGAPEDYLPAAEGHPSTRSVAEALRAARGEP